MKRYAALFAMALLAGCSPPHGQPTFPAAPFRADGDVSWYDVGRTGHPNFATSANATGRITALFYDDDRDGRPDRVYDLPTSPTRDLPHAIILLDSIPFDAVRARYAAGQFRYLAPPQKVIPPFPSLTEICFTQFLHADRLPAMVDQYYDRSRGRRVSGAFARWNGRMEPWERRLDYRATYAEELSTYLRPADWYSAELEQCRQVIRRDRQPVTIVYTTSASGLVSRHGKSGLDAALDGVDRLCLQLLYETRGRIDITVMADHGHNLRASKNVDFTPTLEAAGFRVSDSIQTDRDVVLELTGLVTYLGIHTRQPAAVAAALSARDDVELATYVEGDAVIVRDRRGRAAIDRRGDRLRYRPIDADVLGYRDAVRGGADADGFRSPADWLSATADLEFPGAPPRFWDAFHGSVDHTPDVMVTVRDGWEIGLPSLEKFIKMASTHGGLNQVNSATFVMSMTNRVVGPIRTGDLLDRLEPGFTPPVKRK